MTRLRLSEVRLRCVVQGHPLDAATEACLKADGRPGAQAILSAVARRRAANRAEGQRLRKLLRYETALWSAGIARVAGVDEVGMSPLAGPVAAAAVIFAPGQRLPGIDDSKKLDAATRRRLAGDIKTTAVAWCVAFADVQEIDSLNIYWASRLAMRRAIDGLALPAQHVLVDGRGLQGLPLPQQGIIKGDALSLTIGAASILAKTARDELLSELDAAHPGYGFARHKGYPVPEHIAALRSLGACAVHRRSFAPVRAVLGLPPLPPWPDAAARAATAG